MIGFSLSFSRFATGSDAAPESAIPTGDDTITSNIAEGGRWLAYGSDDVISLGISDDYLNGDTDTDWPIAHDNYGRASISSNYGIVTPISADGRDMLIGQEGNDRLTGGAHAGIIVFHRGYTSDTITDFTTGEDHIQIVRGADGMDGLTFTSKSDDIEIAFSNVAVLMENTTLEQLANAGNFLF
ncbi:hypothetical protein [Phaeobacter sp. C3_T13_0]|uniref:hypothetical protein n=1 Tax=Phaeobacter cretensis TaxID=3342641 RepID=UPI0039BCED72